MDGSHCFLSLSADPYFPDTAEGRLTMPDNRPFAIPAARIALLLLGWTLYFLLSGCATAPKPALKPPEVSLGPVLTVLNAETGSDKVRLVPSPKGPVQALIASSKRGQVVHVTVRENGVSEPEIVLANVSPSRLDGAYDRNGRLHALIDTGHMVLEDGTWRPDAHTPWEATGIAPSWAGFVPGAPDLVWAFVVEGGDVGAALRMDIYGFGGGYPAVGIIWPWFTRGSRLVVAAEGNTESWNVFDLPGRFDSFPLALASDPLGNLHVLYYKALGGLLRAMDLRYASLNVRDLAPDAARHPEGKELKVKDKVLRLQNVSGSRLPKRQVDQRAAPDNLAADPQSGAVLVGTDLLIQGGRYTDEIRGSLAREGGLFMHTAPAGNNAFHATSGPRYGLLTGLEWSAPLELGVAKVASFWGSPWGACDLASTGNGKAFATWPVPQGIMGRWIAWNAPNRADAGTMDHPMWTLPDPGQPDAFEPVHIVIDPPASDPNPAGHARVLVKDVRNETVFRQTTIFDTHMSHIELYPPVPELVRRMVETQADRVLISQVENPPETIECEIAVFDIRTPATMLYWDVETRMELTLHARGGARMVSAAASERTFLWPSQDIIARMVREVLRQAEERTGQELRELLAR